MHPLCHSEGLELFLLILGEDKTPATFPPNILKIAESIAWECDGLPLAISVMARTMKGIHNIQQWRHALNKLGRLEMGTEMEEEVSEDAEFMRNMACHILKESQRCIVRCDQRLREIPHLQGWTADLDLVSLNKNLIREIPVGISPYCPSLLTLILRNNDISSIPECFFTHMKALAILDLSQNHSLTSLPDSLSDLTCLVSLVLRYCLELKYVPTLGRLQKLSRLVISGTSVEVVPDLEMLTNLRWLDLSHNEELPKDLTNLSIDCNACLKSLCDALSNTASSSLMNIEIQSCAEMKSLFCLFGNCSFCNNLNNLQSLQLRCLQSLRVICKEDVADTVLPCAIFSHLRHFKISYCNEIETLVTAGLFSQLQNLQTLTVDSCDSLTEIFAVNSSDVDIELLMMVLPPLHSPTSPPWSCLTCQN
ncbi:probable disease resistance protein At4g27220 [Arachis stenosperma]|uniref:probable disease resistance protein At4g27220 n=1 Tax=Arachis stenosperma TaxID=217475 RepID=UPI0025AB6279|nr:probable disease resistance protein At4g27220 [Arachis stenosperma]